VTFLFQTDQKIYGGTPRQPRVKTAAAVFSKKVSDAAARCRAVLRPKGLQPSTLSRYTREGRGLHPIENLPQHPDHSARNAEPPPLKRIPERRPAGQKIHYPQPVTREQRYLILEYKVGMFEGVVHEDNEFAHDGGEATLAGLPAARSR